jgi:hypothetical protein
LRLRAGGALFNSKRYASALAPLQTAAAALERSCDALRDANSGKLPLAQLAKALHLLAVTERHVNGDAPARASVLGAIRTLAAFGDATVDGTLPLIDGLIALFVTIVGEADECVSLCDPTLYGSAVPSARWLRALVARQRQLTTADDDVLQLIDAETALLADDAPTSRALLVVDKLALLRQFAAPNDVLSALDDSLDALRNALLASHAAASPRYALCSLLALRVAIQFDATRQLDAHALNACLDLFEAVDDEANNDGADDDDSNEREATLLCAASTFVALGDLCSVVGDSETATRVLCASLLCWRLLQSRGVFVVGATAGEAVALVYSLEAFHCRGDSNAACRVLERLEQLASQQPATTDNSTDDVVDDDDTRNDDDEPQSGDSIFDCLIRDCVTVARIRQAPLLASAKAGIDALQLVDVASKMPFALMFACERELIRSRLALEK